MQYQKLENNQQPPKSKLQDGMTPGLHHPANQQLQNQQCGEVVSAGDTSDGNAGKDKNSIGCLVFAVGNRSALTTLVNRGSTLGSIKQTSL
jgi:hypothetical protein